MAEGAPVLEPLEVGVGLAEELEFHLLKFADTENEVSGSDLVAEGLTDLSDTEGKLLTGSSLHVCEVYKDTLSGFGTKINGVLCVLGNTLEGLEHQVELTDIGEVVLAAGGAGDVVVLNKVLHFLLAEGIDGLLEGNTLLSTPVLNKLVGTETLLALTAIHKRIGEAAEVTRCDPGLRIHQDSGIESDVIGIFLDELLPPSTLDVVLQLGTERAVVPSVSQTAVDLAARVNKSAALGEVDDSLHFLFVVKHYISHL